MDLAPSASIGSSQFPNDAYDAETLLKNADIVMYRAKREGPGRHRFFTAEPTEPADPFSGAIRLTSR